MYFGRRAMRDHPAKIERGDPVADPEHKIGVMLDQQHTDAAVTHDPYDRAKVLDLRHRQATRRFVQQNEFGRSVSARAISRKRCAVCSSKSARRSMTWPSPTPRSMAAARSRNSASSRRGRGKASAVSRKPAAYVRPSTQHGVVEHRQRQHQLRRLEGACQTGARRVPAPTGG